EVLPAPDRPDDALAIEGVVDGNVDADALATAVHRSFVPPPCSRPRRVLRLHVVRSNDACHPGVGADERIPQPIRGAYRQSRHDGNRDSETRTEKSARPAARASDRATRSDHSHEGAWLPPPS